MNIGRLGSITLTDTPMNSIEPKIRYEVLALEDKRTCNLAREEKLNFDLDEGAIEARYRDEIALARSKRIWNQTLQAFFDLRSEEDYQITKDKLSLTLKFLSPSGRYAFWRIISGQLPDVQFLIETAHIPDPRSADSDVKTSIITIDSKLPDFDLSRASSSSKSVQILVAKQYLYEAGRGIMKLFKKLITSR